MRRAYNDGMKNKDEIIRSIAHAISGLSYNDMPAIIDELAWSLTQVVCQMDRNNPDALKTLEFRWKEIKEAFEEKL